MWIHWPYNHSDSTVWEILPERTPPEMPIQAINYCLTSLRGQNHNQHRRDQGLPPPQLPLPLPDHGFESDRSAVSTASLMSSLSDRSKGSQHPQWCRQHGETRDHMKINLPIFKRWGHKGCCDLPKLEVGFDSIPSCRMQRSFPPPVHHLVLIGLSWRITAKLRDRYHLRWCVYHTRWTL